MNRHTRSRQRPKSPDPRRTAYVRGKLLERRKDLLERLMTEMTSTAEPSGRSPGDIVDMAATIADQETLYRIGSVEFDAVDQIDHALDRLDEGTYGICEDCGKRIPATRLRVLPFAYLCVLCKRKREQGENIGDMSALQWEDIEDFSGSDFQNPEEIFGSIRGRRPT